MSDVQLPKDRRIRLTNGYLKWDIIHDPVIAGYISEMASMSGVTLEKSHRPTVELIQTLKGALELIYDMSRFVGKMALQDYAKFNEVPMALEHLIACYEKSIGEHVILEGKVEIESEDSGAALIAEIDCKEHPDFFVRLHGYDKAAWKNETAHPVMNSLRDKRVRITIEVI